MMWVGLMKKTYETRSIVILLCEQDPNIVCAIPMARSSVSANGTYLSRSDMSALG